MELAKNLKYIDAKIHVDIDGKVSYGIPLGFFEKETDFSFKVKKDKLKRDLRYNEIVTKRATTKVCNQCGIRKHISVLKEVIYVDSFKKKNICKDCYKEQ